MPILPPQPRPQRRRIHKIIHATRDKGHAHRLMGILLLHEGRGVVSQISRKNSASPAPSDRYTRSFLAGRPRVFSLLIAPTYAITSPT
jgi:hypothetical protein